MKGYLVYTEWPEDRNLEFDGVYKSKDLADKRKLELMKSWEKAGYCIDWSEEGDWTIDDDCRVWVEEVEIIEKKPKFKGYAVH